VVETDLLSIHRLSEVAYAVRPRGERGGDLLCCNSGFVLLPEGVLVVDAHMEPEGDRAVIEAIGSITDLPIATLVITHPHDDHIGGREAYPPGVEVVAHPRAAAALGRPPDVAVETEWIAAPGTDHEVRVIHSGLGHTDADLVVLSKGGGGVLYMGDHFVNGYIGYLGESFPKEWIESLKRLEALPARHVVPGHGDLTDLAGVRRFRDYLTDFRRSALQHFEAGGSPEAYALPERWSDLGATFFLEENVARAHALWKRGEL
jgi:glyoxylase-like metal-dependent hydrolase (beta-lactamase superfamily II)